MTSTHVAVVTGAGSGMGRSTAQRFLGEGWTVLALDLAPAEIDSADESRLVPVAANAASTAARSTRWPTSPASTRPRPWRR